VTVPACLVEQVTTAAHERGLADRVLRDAPRGLRPSFPTTVRPGHPNMARISRRRRIRAMDCFHSRMVAVKERAVCRKLCSDRFVVTLSIATSSSLGAISIAMSESGDA